MDFKDHFSGHAGSYARYRPTYPDRLYELLYDHVHNFDMAWDCGTGNGQVAVHLADKFHKVMASDASAPQIEHALQHANVEYHVCKAEHSFFRDHCFDLITVGQAIHWFDFERFFNEVRRVMRPGGIFACWTYRFLTIDPELDVILRKFFDEIESYWPPERDHVEALYSTIPFPEDFTEKTFPAIHIERMMQPEDVLNYLETWSSVKNYKNKHSKNPVDLIRNEFLEDWGDSGSQKLITHPMLIKLFSINNL